ncbi:MAG TPA: type II toxin-antitoxin system Phd/YefM family antitoxin [Thermoanaerobaculia bacterium]|jgi:antitoxin Phd
MVKKYSIAEARDNFTSMVHEAEEGTQVELTRRGKPVAVLIGVEDFERLSNKKKGFWEAYQEFRRTHDLVAADIDPDEIWGDARDSSPSSSRDFE